MTHTLKELRAYVNSLIKEQGEDSPVAAWVFTKDDVQDYPEDGVVKEELANKVINNLDLYDHIYTEIFDAIDSELRDFGIL